MFVVFSIFHAESLTLTLTLPYGGGHPKKVLHPPRATYFRAATSAVAGLLPRPHQSEVLFASRLMQASYMWHSVLVGLYRSCSRLHRLIIIILFYQHERLVFLFLLLSPTSVSIVTRKIKAFLCGINQLVVKGFISARSVRLASILLLI